MFKARNALIVFLLFSISIVFAQDKPLSFKEVASNLDKSNTSLAIKAFWQDAVGQEVTWTGKVKDVKGGRGKAQILVANKAGKTYKGYNIVLTTFDMDQAAKLKKDQRIRFSGLLQKYKNTKSGGVIFYLTEVEILKAK